MTKTARSQKTGYCPPVLSANAFLLCQLSASMTSCSGPLRPGSSYTYVSHVRGNTIIIIMDKIYQFTEAWPMATEALSLETSRL